MSDVANAQLDIAKFREKYPKYDNVPDREIISVYNMVKAKNAPKRPEGRKGVPGLVEAGVTGAVRAPKMAYDIAAGLLTGIGPTAKQAVTEPSRFGKNILAGLASGGAGLMRAPENIVNYLKEMEILPESVQAPSVSPLIPEDYDYRKAVGLEDVQKGDELAYGLSQFAPNLVLGPAAPAAWAAGQQQNIVEAALAPKVLGLPKYAKERLTPSSQVMKHINKEVSFPELRENLRITQGSETPLGDVVKSPHLKKVFENKLAQEPEARIHETYERIGQDIAKRENNLLNNVIGEGAPKNVDPNPFIKDVLVKAQENSRAIKNNLYNEATKLADKEGLQLELKSFDKLVADNAEAINKSPLLKTNADFRKLYNKLAGIKTAEAIESPIVDQFGRPEISRIERPSITDAKVIANDFYSDGQRMKYSPNAIDRSTGNLYLKLAKALREDVKENIIEKGSKELQEEFNTAEKFYQDDFVRFLDKDLYKLLSESKNPEVIVREIIKPGAANDRHVLIDKVQEILPENQKNLLGYSYFRQALNQEGILEPGKLDTYLKKLGPRQFKSLFPEESTRKALKDYSKLKRLNQEALSYLANPKTGARNTKFLGDFYKNAGNVFGALIGAKSGGALGMVLGSLAASKISGLRARYAARLLTDTAFREKVVNRIEALQKQGKRISNREIYNVLIGADAPRDEPRDEPRGEL